MPTRVVSNVKGTPTRRYSRKLISVPARRALSRTIKLVTELWHWHGSVRRCPSTHGSRVRRTQPGPAPEPVARQARNHRALPVPVQIRWNFGDSGLEVPTIRAIFTPPSASFCPSRSLGNGHTKGGRPSRKTAMSATAYFAAVGEARANRAGDACVWSRPPASDFVTPVDTLARLQQFWSEMA